MDPAEVEGRLRHGVSRIIAQCRLPEFVAALHRMLGAPMVSTGRIRKLNPGRAPGPLRFASSFPGEPNSPIVETADLIARNVARDFAK